MNDLEKLIENKKAFDRKQRINSLMVILLLLLIIVIIFIFTTKTREHNIDLQKEKDTAIAINNLLKAELKIDIVECIGVPNGSYTANGLPLYDFKMKISDTLLNSSLIKVEYYFADVSYNPKLKCSENSKENFSIGITNSWGCMSIVPIYLYYKDSRIDTILFPMCKKAKLQLPNIN